MDAHDHLVRFDEGTRELVIYRVDAEGRKSLYTSTALPKSSDLESVAAFAKQLGENLLIDSPVARRLLKL